MINMKNSLEIYTNRLEGVLDIGKAYEIEKEIRIERGEGEIKIIYEGEKSAAIVVTTDPNMTWPKTYDTLKKILESHHPQIKESYEMRGRGGVTIPELHDKAIIVWYESDEGIRGVMLAPSKLMERYRSV